MSARPTRKKSAKSSPDFLGAEYKGQKALIRRSLDYNVTISAVRKSFKALRSVPAERISVTAFMDDLGDTFEVPEDVWPKVIPKLDRVTIVLDSAAPGQPKNELGAVASGSRVKTAKKENAPPKPPPRDPYDPVAMWVNQIAKAL